MERIWPFPLLLEVVVLVSSRWEMQLEHQMLGMVPGWALLGVQSITL